jgi:hypothetical protein
VHFLLIKNVSDRPILVSWEKGDANKLRIARSQSVRGVVETMVGTEIVVALGPEIKVVLPLFKPGNYDRIAPDDILEIDLHWRFAQPRIWKRDRTIHVRISKRDFDYMVDNYIPPTDVTD